jgi:hypothetical protein
MACGVPISIGRGWAGRRAQHERDNKCETRGAGPAD